MSAANEIILPEAARLSGRRLAWQVALVLPLLLGPLWAAALTPHWPEAHLATWSGAILLALVAACAYTDTRWHRIYNWATYTAFLWGILLNAAAGFSEVLGRPLDPESLTTAPWLNLGAIGIGKALLAGAVTFVLMFVLYRLSGGGAGDVKIATAIAVHLGLEQGLAMLAFSYLAAGIYGVSLLIWHVGPWACLVYLLRKGGNKLLPGWVAPPQEVDKGLMMKRIPLGGFFAIGTLAVLTEGLMW